MKVVFPEGGPFRGMLSEPSGAWFVTSFGFLAYSMASIGRSDRDQRAL